MRKLLGIFTTAFMVAVGLVALPAPTPPAQAAPPGSAFDPGLIISDSVFFDFGAMTLDQIQSFLDSRVPNCRATDPALDCLKTYKSDIPEIPATLPGRVGPCSAIPAKQGATAAEIIFAVANSCGINPKVLIVTLQKEQGLVTSTRPTSYMYRAAMGYGCPDSDPAICGKVYVGLFNQLYHAAKQFRWYGNPAGSFTYWKPGRTVTMRYSPRANCGTTSFPLKSQATANLYYYTPYTPNAAALNNLYGTGDACSAYGNRNFWRFFHDWFGSPIGGGFLLKAEGTDTFLIVDNLRYRIPDPRLATALRPLGPLGEISQGYLDSFIQSGDMTQLVKAPDGSFNLLVDGIRYTVPNCDIARHFGSSCDAAVSLSTAQLNVFVDGGALTRVVESAGSRFWIEDGKSRAVVDQLALTTVGAQDVPVTKLALDQVIALTPGPALASELTVFGLTNSKDVALVFQGVPYRFAATLAAAIPLSTWFKSSTVNVAQSAISANQVMVNGFVQDAQGNRFVLTNSGKLKVTDPENWLEQFTPLPSGLLDLIPTAQGELAAPAVVTFPNASASYIVQAGERRTVSNSSMATSLLRLLEQPAAVVIPHAAVASIRSVGEGFAPGSLIRANGSSTIFLVDGLGSKVTLANQTQARALSAGTIFSFDRKLVNQLKTRTGFTSNLVQCGGGNYLVDAGTLHPLSPEVAAEYPGKAFPLEVSTCAALKVSSKPAGQFVRSPAGRYFFIEDGKKRSIRNFNAYKALQTAGPAYLKVSDALLTRIPNGSAVGSSVTLAAFANAPTGVFSDIRFTGDVTPVVTPSPSPTPSPTPSASPTQSPRPTATPSPSATATPTPSPTSSPNTSPSTYTVKSGDTLSGIAARFRVTLSALRSANPTVTSDRIVVGQVLRIPSATSSPTPTPTASPTPTATPTPTPSPSPTRTPTPSPSPTPVEVVHVVRSGDSLISIARRYSVTVKAIQDLNGITNPDKIRIGQRIRIPGRG